MAVALLTRLTNPIASPSSMATRRSMVAWKVLSPTFWSCTPSSTAHTIQTCIICKEANIWNQAAAGAQEEEEEEPTCSEPGGAKHLTGVQLRVMKSYIGKIKKKKNLVQLWSSFMCSKLIIQKKKKTVNISGLTFSNLQHGEAHVVAELHSGEFQQGIADLWPQQVTAWPLDREGDVHGLPN